MVKLFLIVNEVCLDILVIKSKNQTALVSFANLILLSTDNTKNYKIPTLLRIFYFLIWPYLSTYEWIFSILFT